MSTPEELERIQQEQLEQLKRKMDIRLATAAELRRGLRTVASFLSFEISAWPSRPARAVEIQAGICHLQDLPPQTPAQLPVSNERFAKSVFAVGIVWDSASQQLFFSRKIGGNDQTVVIGCAPGSYFLEGPINASGGHRTPGCFHPSICQLQGALMVVDDESFKEVEQRGILVCSHQPLGASLMLNAALLPAPFWVRRPMLEKPADRLAPTVFYPLDPDGVVSLSQKIARQPVSAQESPLILIAQAPDFSIG